VTIRHDPPSSAIIRHIKLRRRWMILSSHDFVDLPSWHLQQVAAFRRKLREFAGFIFSHQLHFSFHPLSCPEVPRFPFI
jgi:hypothetical protein